MGASLCGTGAELVTVEARHETQEKDSGRPEVLVTGLPDPVLRESRGRLLPALEVSGLRLPRGGRLYLNLVPAARRKSGEGLDLSLALAAAAAGGHLEPAALDGVLLLGELGIDGRLHDVPGGLAAALTCRQAGIGRLIAPESTAREAACLDGLEVYTARNLGQVVAHLTPSGKRLPAACPPEDLEPQAMATAVEEVRGQGGAIYALTLAAAGGHALLLIGPPGVGKSLLARCLPELLAPPDLEERLEITGVLSAAGRWPGGLVTRRPFRAPHHTASQIGLVGGGPQLAPGEISLAHRGVLFLDELPEFSRESLESLRQPLEEGRIGISRAGRQLELPARFQLVVAMNPCPCGYLGHGTIPCTCSARAVLRYRQRISGPLLDRIDLRMELSAPRLEQLAREPEERGGALLERIAGARGIRRERGQTGTNAALRGADLDQHAPLDGAAMRLLGRAGEQRELSARAVQSLRRVARTVADVAGSEPIGESHWATALGLRAPLLEGLG